MYPVGCPVAGSLEPLGIDKGLQEVYRVIVNAVALRIIAADKIV
jgi:hypothetical protein